MKRYVFHILAFGLSILIVSVVLLAIYGKVTKEIANKSLAANDFLTTEGLPNIYGDLQIIAYNFDHSATAVSQLSALNRGALIIADQNDTVLFQGAVKEGDTLEISGYEVMITKIRL